MAAHETVMCVHEFGINFLAWIQLKYLVVSALIWYVFIVLLSFS